MSEKMKKFSCYLPLCILLLLTHLAAQEQPTVPIKPISLTKKISQENLKTLIPKDAASSINTLNTPVNGEKSFAALVEEKVLSQFNLDPFAKRQAVFALLDRYEEEHPISHSDVLEEWTWKDLEILYGPKTNPALYVAAKVDRTVTEIGRAMLYKAIIQPKLSFDELNTQQKIIKKLVEDESLFSDLDNNLKKLAIPENILLSFWRDDILSSLMQQPKISFPFQDKVSDLNDLSTWINKEEYLEMTTNVTRFAFFIISLSILATTVVTVPAEMVFEWYNPGACDTMPGGHMIKKINSLAPKELDPLTMSGAISNGFGLFWSDNTTFKAAVRITAFCFAAWGAWTMIKQLRDGLKINDLVQKKLIHLSTYIDSLNTMISSIKKHADLCNLMPHIAHLDTTIQSLRAAYEDFNHLLDLLGTDTFKGEPSFFSFWSRIDIAYRLMEQEKEKFNDIMIAIGELDACMSTARLYKEMKNKRVYYCFPEYQEIKNNRPQVTIQDFWHPGLDDRTVVVNSLDIHDKNIVITGPNAAGKSTIMKAFVISIIMAQALGIAPAKSLSFTPFSKIITYLNITDDIAAGNSHFKAGVLRARTVVEHMHSVSDNNVGLAVVDEVFNGTTFKEGQAAAFSLIKHLGSQKNSLIITTTHFPLMVDMIKTDDRFLNYKVYVEYDENGKIIYPYKLEPGISDQVVTLKILKEEGFTDAFIQDAEAILRG